MGGPNYLAISWLATEPKLENCLRTRSILAIFSLIEQRVLRSLPDRRSLFRLTLPRRGPNSYPPRVRVYVTALSLRHKDNSHNAHKPDRESAFLGHDGLWLFCGTSRLHFRVEHSSLA